MSGRGGYTAGSRRRAEESGVGLRVESVEGEREISYVRRGGTARAMRSFACELGRRLDGAGKPRYEIGGGVGGPEEDADEEDEELLTSGGNE
jgi:hypothetical protein